VFGAIVGSVSVTRRWSVEPVFNDASPLSAKLAPITGRVASTVLVVPPHVYVYAGEVPASVHATEHLSMTICRPLVMSVSSSELGEAVVLSTIEDRLSAVPLPLLMRSTERWIVSPGTTLEAPIVRRFAAPVVPSAIETVPDEIVWLAEVELVNVANVPSPAIAAVTPTTANEPSTRLIVLLCILVSILGLENLTWARSRAGV
jgi:hypothetical protein